jgi:hypothetical protein
MAKLSELVACCSEATGVPMPEIRELSRRLREAGLIRTGKGGRYGGADMMPEDAASLLTAVLIARASSLSLGDVVRLTRSHLREFRSYIPRSDHLPPGHWGSQLALPQLCHLGTRHTFGDAFSALIASISSGDLERAIKRWDRRRPHGVGAFFRFSVSITSPRPHPEALIEFDTAATGLMNLIYLRPRDANKLTVPDAPRKWSDLSTEGFDLLVTATVRMETLTSVGILLRNSENYDG